MNTLPVSVSLPWGLNVGGVGLLPHVPLPSKLRTAVLAPVQPLGVAGLRPYLLVPTRRVTSVLDPMRPGEGETPEAFGDRVEAAMQAELSAMTDHRKLLLG